MLKFRFRAVQFSLCLLFLAVLTRLGYLQLWCHAELTRKAEHQFERTIQQAPRRGPVLDREGRVLTDSVRVASCYADPSILRRPEKIAKTLAGPLQMPASSIVEKVRKASGSFVWLKRFIPIEQAQAIEELNLYGIGVKWEYKRAYPNGDLASHLLGFVGMEGQGLSGVELVANDWLVDTRPPRHAMRDGRGTGVSDSPVEDDGNDRTWVKLSLDRTIQFIAERELEWGMARSRSKHGLIVVQDPWTGEVLAVASRPKLTMGSDARVDPEQLLIPAFHWVFEPGSTMKAITTSAAIEENVVKPSDLLNCENGHWKYQSMTIHDHEKDGVMSFAQVIERSSNIGTAKVGLRLGKTKLYDYFRAFGIGSRSGSEMPGESGGLLKPLNKWSGVSLPVMSFGQEVGVTAIQLAAAYSAIANGGMLLEPRIFQEMVNEKGEHRTWQTPSPVRRVVSKETTETVKKILEGVVLRGTGKPAQLDGWSVAGKTGTAQKIDPKTHQYSPSRFIASFCGFVPVKKPRLTIVVVYDEPQGVSYGGYNAGPVFRNVAWHALTYMGVPSDVAPEVKVASAKKLP